MQSPTIHSMRPPRSLIVWAALALGCLFVAMVGGCRKKAPSYNEDVAPILARHCLQCHRAGGTSFALEDFKTVARRAKAIKYAVGNREMPPWGVDNTGFCGTWEGSRWLTTEEIATVLRWVDEGAREGDAEGARPRSPSPADAEVPFRADAVVDLGGDYQPDIGSGGYRCFVSDPKLPADRLLTGIRVSASDPRGLVRLSLFALDSDAAEQDVAARDEAAPGSGYPCYGTLPTPDTRLVASWTTGPHVLRLPDATGVRLRANRKMVLQVQFNVMVPGREYRTFLPVDLELRDGAREVTVVAVMASGDLPPNKKDVSVEARYPVTRKMSVVGVAPRMHVHGKVMQLVREREGRTTCLATFDHWTSSLQQLFRATKASELEPGDVVRLSCAYRTVGEAEPIRFGESIDEEECVASLFVLEP